MLKIWLSLSICLLYNASMRRELSLTVHCHARESLELRLDNNCIITRPKHKHSSPTCLYSPLPCIHNKHIVFHVNCWPKRKWKVECDWLHAVCVWVPSEENSIQEDIRLDPQFWAPPRPRKLHRQCPLSEDNWPGKKDIKKKKSKQLKYFIEPENWCVDFVLMPPPFLYSLYFHS